MQSPSERLRVCLVLRLTASNGLLWPENGTLHCWWIVWIGVSQIFKPRLCARITLRRKQKIVASPGAKSLLLVAKTEHATIAPLSCVCGLRKRNGVRVCDKKNCCELCDKKNGGVEWLPGFWFAIKDEEARQSMLWKQRQNRVGGELFSNQIYQIKWLGKITFEPKEKNHNFINFKNCNRI